MEQDAILERLTGVFRATFDDPSLVLTPETTAKDIPAWDSIIHITLIVEVEQAFGVRFQMSEIEGLKTVGAWVSLIRGKL
jgi:acyl carrier protein